MDNTRINIVKNFLNDLEDTPEWQCSYFPGLVSKNQAFITKEKLDNFSMGIIIQEGFRRSGNYFYRPTCDSCNRCISYRVPVQQFKLSRSQRRLINKNINLKFTVGEPRLTDEKKEIYLKYQYWKHHNSENSTGEYIKDDTFNIKESLETLNSQMYTLHLGTAESIVYFENKIVGFGILDIGESVASTVYFVFDPGFAKLSLGTWSIIKEIIWAKENGFKYYHLGFYIPGHPKMEYKSNFAPGEIRNNQGMWQSYNDLSLQT